MVRVVTKILLDDPKTIDVDTINRAVANAITATGWERDVEAITDELIINLAAWIQPKLSADPQNNLR